MLLMDLMLKVLHILQAFAGKLCTRSKYASKPALCIRRNKTQELACQKLDCNHSHHIYKLIQQNCMSVKQRWPKPWVCMTFVAPPNKLIAALAPSFLSQPQLLAVSILDLWGIQWADQRLACTISQVALLWHGCIQGFGLCLTLCSCATDGRAATSKLKHCFRVCCSHSGRVVGTAGGRLFNMADINCIGVRSG